jgi:site-specific recombinase XerD
LLHALNHAIRYEWLGRNPFTLVRKSAKRERVPEVLDAEELKELLSEIETTVLDDGVFSSHNGAHGSAASLDTSE